MVSKDEIDALRTVCDALSKGDREQAALLARSPKLPIPLARRFDPFVVTPTDKSAAAALPGRQRISCANPREAFHLRRSVSLTREASGNRQYQWTLRRGSARSIEGKIMQEAASTLTRRLPQSGQIERTLTPPRSGENLRRTESRDRFKPAVE